MNKDNTAIVPLRKRLSDRSLGVKPVQKAAVPGDPTFLRGNYRRDRNDTSEVSRRPYAFHSWVYACSTAISRNLANLQKVLKDVGRKPPVELLDHEVLKVLRRPNPYMTGSEFWESIVLSLMLPTLRTPGGQVFLVPVAKDGGNVNLRRGEIPAEFWPFNDTMMFPDMNEKTNFIVGWRLELDGKVINRFTHDEIIRIRLLNPYSEVHGQSPYSAAQASVIQDTKADIYNTLYYDNQGAIGGLLTSDEELTREQMRESLDSWYEQYGGAGNNGKTAIMANGLKYQQFAQSLVDMQFGEQRIDNRKRLQAAYGCPDAELSIYESGMNRATAEQSDRNFWQKTLLPLDSKINEAINCQWIENLDRGQWRLASDLKRVMALLDNLTEKIENAKKLFDMRVSPAEALRIADVPIEDVAEHLEKSFVNGSLVDADVLAKAGLIDYTEPAEDPPKEPEPKKDDKEKGDKKKFLKAKSDELERVTRRLISDLFIKTTLSPGEKSMKRMFDKFFNSLKREMLDKVDSWLKSETNKSLKAIIVSPRTFLFNRSAANEDLTAEYKPEVETQMNRAADSALKDLDIEEFVTFGVNPENIEAYMELRSKMLVRINTTTFNAARNEISSIINQGVTDNLTANQLAGNLKEGIKRVSNIRVNNATTIARTEVGTITSMTRHNAFRKEGIKDIEWLSSGDELVRPEGASDNPEYNHRIDGEQTTIAGKFSNGLRYPHDPDGAAGNVINCRCVELPVFK